MPKCVAFMQYGMPLKLPTYELTHLPTLLAIVRLRKYPDSDFFVSRKLLKGGGLAGPKKRCSKTSRIQPCTADGRPPTRNEAKPHREVFSVPRCIRGGSCSSSLALHFGFLACVTTAIVQTAMPQKNDCTAATIRL